MSSEDDYNNISESEIEEINNLFNPQPKDLNQINWNEFYKSLDQRSYLLPDLVSRFNQYFNTNLSNNSFSKLALTRQYFAKKVYWVLHTKAIIYIKLFD